MIRLLTYWFKVEASKAAKKVLVERLQRDEIEAVLTAYWKKFMEWRHEVPKQLTLGGTLMVNLAVMSAAYYRELTARGHSEKEATQMFYDTAWEVYVKMGRFSWWLAGLGKRDNYERLLKATRLFRSFPFSSPSYRWEDVRSPEGVVGFDCLKCPVAEYFQSQGLSSFCAETWCKLDHPLAELWHAQLERQGSIAGGAAKCDFRWVAGSVQAEDRISGS